MNELCTQLVSGLFRSGLVLTISALVVMLLMRRFPITSSRLRRLVYFAVILQGCLLLKLPSELFSVQVFKAAPIQQLRFDDDRTEQIRALAFDVAEAMFAGDLATRPVAVANSVKWQFPWMITIAGAWIVGIVVLVGQSVWHYVWFLREVGKRTRPSAGWDEEWKALQQRYRSKHQVTFKLCEGVGPLVCFQPSGYQLIVPSEVWGMLEPRQRMMILRHELAHLQRCDLWKSLAIRLLALAHWFNPLVWKLVRRFDEDAECACDDAVRIADSTSAIDYARTLLLLGGPHGSISLATQAASEPGLADRIRRMVVPAPMKDSNMKKYAIAAVVLAISTLQLLRFELKADEPSALAPENEVSAMSGNATSVEGSTEIAGSNEQGLTISFIGNTIGVASTGEKQPVIDVRLVINNLEEYQLALQNLKRENQSQVDRLRDQIHSAREDDDDAKFKEMQLLLQRQANDTLNKHVNLSMSLYRKIMDEAAIYSQEQHFPPVSAKKRSRQGLSAPSVIDAGQSVDLGNSQFIVGIASSAGDVKILANSSPVVADGSNLTITFSNNSTSTVTLTDNNNFTGFTVSPVAQGIALGNGQRYDAVNINYLNVVDTSNSVVNFATSSSPALHGIVGDIVLTQEQPYMKFAATTASVAQVEFDPRNNIVANQPGVVSTTGHGIFLSSQSGVEIRQPVHAWFAPSLGDTNQAESQFPRQDNELDVSWEIIKRLNAQFEKTRGEQVQTKDSSVR